MTLPKDDQCIDIPYPLYFAKESKKWEYKGVAFIGHKKTDSNITHGRMYLITTEQFIDVVKLENANDIDATISIDFDSVKRLGSKTVCDRWYGNIFYLGEHDNFSVFTFTAPCDKDDKKFITPSDKYLSTIILGLKESYGYSDEEIVKYLSGKPGIEGKIEKDRLIDLSQTVTN